MRSSQMARGFGAFSVLTLAGVSVLVFHSAALAQQAKPDAKETQKAAPEEKAVPEAPAEGAAAPAAPQELPPEYAPPPGYGAGGYRHTPPQPPGYGPGYRGYDYGPPSYPPPRYYRPRYYQPGPARYYPEPTSYRPFFFGIGLGAGGVSLFPEESENVSRAGMSYNLHFGFGVAPRWSIVLAGDGAFAYFDGYDISQSVWSIGPQVFLNKKVYVRLGIGVATKSVDLDSSYDYYSYNVSTHSGMGWTAAIGVEFMQSYHVALGLEAAATYGHYQELDLVTGSRDDGTIGINFMLNLF